MFLSRWWNVQPEMRLSLFDSLSIFLIGPKKKVFSFDQAMHDFLTPWQSGTLWYLIQNLPISIPLF